MSLLYWCVLIIILVSLVSYLLAMIGNVVYILQNKKRKRIGKYPNISVVIPAYNEEASLERCVTHVVASYYPHDKRQIIIANDGSQDRTLEIANRLKEEFPQENIVIYSQKNAGKANVLNNAINKCANGEIIVVMDSDSYPASTAFLNLIHQFSDPAVRLVGSNIRIIQDGSLLNWIQYFEYATCWFAKRGTTALGIDFIVGGIGSAFYKKDFLEVGGYDYDVIVEDIDFTFKFIKAGKKIAYAHDSIMYAPAVLSVKDLFTQRFRWKFGYVQSLWKYRSLFFSRKISFRRAFLYLPFAVVKEIMWLVEPIIPFLILWLLVVHADWISLVTAIAVVSVLSCIQIMLEDTLPKNEQYALLRSLPIMYFGLYLITFVWYFVSYRSILNCKNITYMQSRWEPVARSV